MKELKKKRLQKSHRRQIWPAVFGPFQPALTIVGSKVNSVAFSPDGRYIVSGSNMVQLWDANTGAQESKYVSNSDLIRSNKYGQPIRHNVNSVSFSRDGKYILSDWNSHPGHIRLWDKETGQLQEISDKRTYNEISGGFNSDGKYILCRNSDGTLRLWDTILGRQLQVFQVDADFSTYAQLSPDGKYIAVNKTNGKISLWDTDTGKQIRILTGQSDYSNSAIIIPDSKYIAIVSGLVADGKISLWDKDTGNQIGVFEIPAGQNNYRRSVIFSPDGKYIAVSTAHSIHLWEKNTLRQVKMIKIPTSFNLLGFSPDGKYLLTGASYSMSFWDEETGERIRVFELNMSDPQSIFFNSSRIVLADHGGTIIELERNTGKEIKNIVFSRKSRSSIVLMPTAESIIYALDNGSLEMRRAETDELLLTMISFENNAWVAYTKDNYYNSYKDGDQHVHFRVKNKMYNSEQYAARYKRPDIIAETLRGKRKEDSLNKIESKSIIESKKISDEIPPEIILQYLKSGNSIYEPSAKFIELPEIIIAAKIMDRKNGIEKISIDLNGKVVYERDLLGTHEYSMEVPISLKPKENKI